MQTGARFHYWQALMFAFVAGCATPPQAPAEPPQLKVRSMCDGGGNFVGVVVSASAKGVWELTFDPHEVCDAGT